MLENTQNVQLTSFLVKKKSFFWNMFYNKAKALTIFKYVRKYLFIKQ